MNIWQGEKVRLRALEPEDAEVFYEWDLDTRTQGALESVKFPASLESQREWALAASKKRGENDAFSFVIENEEGNPVGSINSHHCDRRVGAFRYGVAVRAEYRRRGYAADAILVLLRHFFGELRYQKVTIQAASFNEASIELHRKLGFQEEGRIRRVWFTDGKFYDEFVFGLTVEEYNALYGAR